MNIDAKDTETIEMKRAMYGLLLVSIVETGNGKASFLTFC